MCDVRAPFLRALVYLNNFVAPQTNLKMVLQAHSDTLRDIRGFWRELCSKNTTFVSLSEVCRYCQNKHGLIVLMQLVDGGLAKQATFV